MPKILALDTSTDACSVALDIDGEVKQDFRIIPRQHTKQLLPMVQQMLSDCDLKVSDLDAIAVGRGPGSFAGIRIATGAAQGLAFAAELPMLPTSTLAAIALRIYRDTGAEFIVTALDARMNEIYCCAYQIQNGLPVALMPETVCAPGQLQLPEESQHWTVGGSGWCYLEDMSAEVQQAVQPLDDTVYPAAAEIVTLALQDWEAGKAVPPEEALPVYLRDQVAWKKKDQQ
ncbi:tRNA (adenosine(37)-N6)-threonylcarbamoyltransferase complex dimerization subunit type 1 TsaB [Pontibacterium sp.]|uniref:tRNA (adenosine(37)-N6)-threonylcarbamoyltransferase complex dimerization subunit type 1 TsaB n=1 Tax=Pontibacterium sp. TaxID=2036026 RepID=UPI0035642DD7